MKKLHEILKQPQSVGDVGIEIEVEGNNLIPIDTAFWKTEDDNSLRGRFPEERAEYVLNNPIGIKIVPDALQELSEHLNNSELKFSFRCSVHIHINVQELTYPQFLAFLYLSVLMEGLLSEYCGEERKHNRFCLRISDAEGYLETLSAVFQNPAELKFIREGDIRYAFVNIGSVCKYGSLEFRGMKGTLDVRKLTIWVQTLYQMKEMAKKWGDPISVHDAYVKQSHISFSKKVLGKNYKYFNPERYFSLLDRSYSLTLMLPYLFKGCEERLK